MEISHKLSTRVTSQAQKVFQVVTESSGHVTAEQVYTQARKTLPRISLGTVYRNLEQLANRNLISKVVIAGIARYEPYKQQHYHVVCQSCQRVDNLDSEIAVDVEDYFSRITDYLLTGHDLVLFGICPRCQQKRAV